MSEISLKKVFSHNYACRFGLIISILSIITGISVCLSVFEIIPKFPLTEDMTKQTSIIVMAICIGIMLLGALIIKSTIARLKNIFSNGKPIMATITDINTGKHQLLINYEYDFENQHCKDHNNVAKQLNYKKQYAKGGEIEIYAIMSENGKVISAMNIYF